MAVAVVGTPTAVSDAVASGSKAVTIPTPTSGNLLVLSASSLDNVSGITGGGVTTWTKIQFLSGDASHNDSDIWYGVVDTTPSTTVTVTWLSSTSFHVVFVIELSGAQKATDVNVAFGNDTTGTTADSKAIVPLVDGSFIVSSLSNSGAPGVVTGPTGYTHLADQVQGINGYSAAYLIQTSAGSSTMNWSWVNSSNPSMGGVSIKAAASAASPTILKVSVPFMSNGRI